MSLSWVERPPFFLCFSFSVFFLIWFSLATYSFQMGRGHRPHSFLLILILGRLSEPTVSCIPAQWPCPLQEGGRTSAYEGRSIGHCKGSAQVIAWPIAQPCLPTIVLKTLPAERSVPVSIISPMRMSNNLHQEQHQPRRSSRLRRRSNNEKQPDKKEQATWEELPAALAYHHAVPTAVPHPQLAQGDQLAMKDGCKHWSTLPPVQWA